MTDIPDSTQSNIDASPDGLDYSPPVHSPSHADTDEQATENGLGILLKKKILYHGSSTSGIQTFNKAEETTTGEGVYMIPDNMGAIGYARIRTRNSEKQPIVYEALIENLKLIDLRKNENVVKILPGFRDILVQKLHSLENNSKAYFIRRNILSAIRNIDEKKIHAGSLRLIAKNMSSTFTEYIRSLGYDGLMTLEGGEPGFMENHETYLIFDPAKVKILGENKIL